jgi:uncharacterized phage protein gp47/JayE
MPIDTLPQEIAIPERDQIRDDFLADYRFAEGGDADTTEGTLPYLDASSFADSALPLWAQVRRSGYNLVLTEAQGAALEQWAVQSGITEGRRPATGSTGYLVADTSAGGSTILQGDVAKTAAGVRLEVTTTKLYKDGKLIAVRSLDTGPGTNLAPDTVVTWEAPRPGCGPTALVWEDQNGDGLTGGRNAEEDSELLDRILERKRTPPAAANDSHIQQVVRATPGIPVQACWTYPAIKGPGSTAVVFTVLPEGTGSRVPTTTQITAVAQHLQGNGGIPADFSIFVNPLVASLVDVVISVTWRQTGWTDVAPWPSYYAGTSAIKVTAVTDSTHFVLGRASGVYSITSPVAGQVIGFFDTSTQTFLRKTILSVTGTGPWTIVCDTTNEASDTTYTPVVGQRAMPWSDSLDLVVEPIVTYFRGLGPGEQVASFFDAGARQKRSPDSPVLWTSTIGNRLINGVQDLTDVISDAVLLEPSVPLSTPVGTTAVLSYLYELGKVSVFPQ